MQSDKESGLRPPYRNCHLTTGDKGSDAEHHLTAGHTRQRVQSPLVVLNF